MPRTLRTVSWVVALLAVLATGAGYLYRWYQARQADAWALELDGRPAPSFTLASHLGQPVCLVELTGRIIVVTFVYTSCPDVCPLTIHTIAAAHRKLPPNMLEQVQLVAITVDSEHDTVERIAQYVATNNLERFLFLTGDRARLERGWTGFAIGVERRPGASAQETVLHTPVT